MPMEAEKRFQKHIKGRTWRWPFPENGLMPERCEARTPLYQVGAFPNQSRRKKEYEDWVKAGKPRLFDEEDRGEDATPVP